MTWVLLAAGTAVFYALHGAWSKRVSTAAGSLVGAWALFLFALPLLAVYLWVQGVPEVGSRFWPVVAANWVLLLGAMLLFFSALRAGDLGVTYPLLALTPLFVIPVEWVLLREVPGGWGVAGILLVVAGVYLLQFRERRRGPLAPLRALMESPGARRALGVAVIWSVSGTLDRVAVLESSPSFYGVALAGGLSVLFLPVLAWNVHRSEDSLRSRLSSAGPVVLVVHGFLFVAMFVLQMEALRLALASYVLSIKRTGALLAVLLGWLAFREEGLRYRLLGTAVTLAGVTVLVVWG